MTEYFIALDVHCAFTEMAVVTGSGKLVRRDRLETSIPALRTAIAAVPRPHRVYRGLRHQRGAASGPGR